MTREERESYRAWLEVLPNYERSMVTMLGDGQWHSQQDMVDATSFRFGAIIHTLRKKGFDIEKRHLGGTLWEYRLVGVPSRSEAA
ncbi:MAG: hypothetical protein IVW36_07560 [Dehalococcoidia bacterium]|nr:hypothetical protein [Dehalococcoidia bacterium]